MSKKSAESDKNEFEASPKPSESPSSPGTNSAYKISDKFTTEKLMMMLDKEKLAALEEEFERHPEGLAPQKFVS